MKIAIQGHPTRGKEILSLLESFGGVNHHLTGDGQKSVYYYIDENNAIRCGSALTGYKLYTMEEFEKEFPFKVGDKVTITSNIPYKIVALEYYMGMLWYRLDNGLHYISKVLKPYKEMEERNITLTLEKAKEWYKKGGELKEIALQAFSEKELTKIELPKTWEEFCKNYPVKDKEAHVDSISNIVIQDGNTTWRASTRDRNICPSKKSAEAHLAMIQLEQLRNCWWNGWEPIWDASHKYCIKNVQGEITTLMCSNVAAFLVFPTIEMAEEFLKCFRNLIEKAGDFI